jgi:hypothetical protein
MTERAFLERQQRLPYKLKEEQQQQNSKEAIEEIDKVNNQMVEKLMNEAISLIGICYPIYGNKSWKTAWSHINLAQIYLEFKGWPLQSKEHCEKAMKILVDEFEEISLCLAHNQLPIRNKNINKHQAILNFVYGRSCTLLREYDVFNILKLKEN